jgi:hypothetical protein
LFTLFFSTYHHLAYNSLSVWVFVICSLLCEAKQIVFFFTS